MFHFSATLNHIFVMYQKIRTIVFYKEYFQDFFSEQKDKVKDKIIWTLTLIEEIERVSGHYIKHIEGTDGFQKKTQKTPIREIQKALKIKQDYESDK